MIMRGWSELVAHIKAHPINGSALAQREAFARLAPDSVPGEIVCVGGLPCWRWPEKRRVTCNLGAWRRAGLGSPQTHSAMAANLAKRMARSALA